MRSRSRSPRITDGARCFRVDPTVPAPDADGATGECGPLPIMPGHSADLPIYIEHVVRVGDDTIPVTFAVVPGWGDAQVPTRGLYDEGAYSRELWSRIEWDRDDLIALSQAQMLRVQPPHIPNPTRLWSLRGQRMPFCDRLALLRNQLGAVADDEIRYHLNALKEECLSGVDFPAKEIVVVDPLVCAAWIDPVSFDCTEWAAMHPDFFEVGLQVVGVFCFDSHWIPVLITPWGENVRVASFDATPALPDEIASVLTRVVHALGFTEIHFDHVPRTFAMKTVCGAVAINFLRSQVGGFPRLGTNFSAWEEHHCLRRRFMQYAGNVTEVPRPWFWGLGEATDDPTDEVCLGLSEEQLRGDISAPPNDNPVQVTLGRLVDLSTGGVRPADLNGYFLVQPFSCSRVVAPALWIFINLLFFELSSCPVRFGASFWRFSSAFGLTMNCVSTCMTLPIDVLCTKEALQSVRLLSWTLCSQLHGPYQVRSHQSRALNFFRRLPVISFIWWVSSGLLLIGCPFFWSRLVSVLRLCLVTTKPAFLLNGSIALCPLCMLWVSAASVLIMINAFFSAVQPVVQLRSISWHSVWVWESEFLRMEQFGRFM